VSGDEASFDFPFMLNSIIRALEKISLSPDAQIKWLLDEDFPVNELFEQLEDVTQDWLDHVESERLVPSSTADRIRQFRERMLSFDSPAFWTISAIQQDPTWDQIRLDAHALVEELQSSATGD
jgi:hypothetical protein